MTSPDVGQPSDQDGDRPPMPDGLEAERRTPTFTAETVPPALLGDHRAAVWARLEVEQGSVRFVESGVDGAPDIELVATPDSPVTIVPNRPHRVDPSTDARFAVQFFRPPSPR